MRHWHIVIFTVPRVILIFRHTEECSTRLLHFSRRPPYIDNVTIFPPPGSVQDKQIFRAGVEPVVLAQMQWKRAERLKKNCDQPGTHLQTMSVLLSD